MTTLEKETKDKIVFSGYNRWAGSIFFRLVGKDYKGKKLIVPFKLEFDEKKNDRIETVTKAEIMLGNVYYPAPRDISTIRAMINSIKDFDQELYNKKIQKFFDTLKGVPAKEIVDYFMNL